MACWCLQRRALTAVSRASVAAKRFTSGPLSRYGLGGHNWKAFSPESYRELIHQALSHQVSYLEIAGHGGGEIAMVGALQSAIERSPDLAERPLTVTTRIGYRTLVGGDDAQLVISRPGDVVMNEEGEAPSSIRTTVVHNLSSSFVEESIQSSPLLELQADMPNLRLVYLLQNPEVQVLELLKLYPDATPEARDSFIQARWSPALDMLEEYSTSTRGVSFGVVSNGLGIPARNNHPMHLNADIVIDAANKFSRFLAVQLPANLLERQGWEIARKIKAEAPSVSIGVIRPLTCYPDLGTGKGHPFRLVDYALPSIENGHPFAPISSTAFSTSTSTTHYTHEMRGVPSIYQIALQTAMSHFDAEEILQAKQERDLTTEERETLDGCKLVQSMIYDLDADLDRIRSFTAHEEELYGRIIPLLYDTFEAMDDHTSDVLQAYFAAYAVAVRFAIAKKTRQVLCEGEMQAEMSTPKYPDIPSSMSLQEYSVRRMLAEPAFDRIIAGASTLQDFSHLVQLIEDIGTENGSPLDAIVRANEALGAKQAQLNQKA